MGKKINVGLVGCGYPTWNHIKAYRKVEGVNVLALCDVNPQMLKKVADEYNIPKTFINFEDMLELKELDAVSICTPNFLHVPQSLKALNAGKHVICEKPLSINAKESIKLREPIKKSGKVFMLAYVMRFFNHSKYIKCLVEEDELGEIYHADAFTLAQKGIPGLGGWFTNKKLSGGGVLIDWGVHALDLYWWLMGCPKPVSVFGEVYSPFISKGSCGCDWGVSKITRKLPADVEDMAVGSIKFADNKTLSFEFAWASCISLDVRKGSIFGTKGGAETSPLKVIRFSGNSHKVLKPELPELNGFEGEISHFIDCIRHNKKPMADIEQGITIMKIIDAVYESSKTGKMIKIR